MEEILQRLRRYITQVNIVERNTPVGIIISTDGEYVDVVYSLTCSQRINKSFDDVKKEIKEFLDENEPPLAKEQIVLILRTLNSMDSCFEYRLSVIDSDIDIGNEELIYSVFINKSYRKDLDLISKQAFSILESSSKVNKIMMVNIDRDLFHQEK